MTTKLKLVAVGVLLITGTAHSAGWRARCRAQARACRGSRGASLTSTTTTVPPSDCLSQNCHGQCIMVNGQTYVLVSDALAGLCSLPFPAGGR